jgi:acyl-coenzyme A thioesterase PaaI-like protein
MFIHPDNAHFESIPWCKNLLSDPAYLIVPSRSRHVKKDGEDALTGRTINSASTIAAWLTQIKIPTPEDGLIEELRALMTLGPELDGYPHICHGGIQATILDEVMGNLVGSNESRKFDKARAAGEDAEKAAIVTAELLIKYLKPVLTPSTVCVNVRITKLEGRKIWLDGSIEDETGRSLATGTALYVEVRKQKM